MTAPPTCCGGEVDFAAQIKPILSARCYACHSALRKKSGLRLDTAAALIAGGDAGAAVEPGDSAKSYLIKMLTGVSGTRMPPAEEGAALTDEQIALVRKWIDEGAHAPAETPPPDPREHWSYQQPQRPSVPHVKNEAWVRNPIDAFVAERHAAQGLEPVGEADKAMLLRRVYLDLVGLPPTREELAAFLANDSPGAYEQVVDRLLASPQYGERWARHWMDVWRYSDWSGYKMQVRDSAPFIWRWRDWIVESLNADKGYDRMTIEMLAGDEIAPTDPATLRATGFLVRNWYKFSRDVWLQNTVEHTSKAFLGVTLNCCRCHDHKFDPISQEEYYRFRAIFEPHDLRTDRVPGQPDKEQDALQRIADLKLDAPTYLYERGDEKRAKKDEPLAPGVPATFGGALKIEAVDLPVVAHYPGLQEFALKEDLQRASERIVAAEKSLLVAQTVVAAIQKTGKPSDGTTKVAVATGAVGGVAKPQIIVQPKMIVAKPATAGKKKPALVKPVAPAAESLQSPPKSLDAAVAMAEVASRQLATARAAERSLTARIAAEKAKYGITKSDDSHALAIVAATADRSLSLCQAQEQQAAAAVDLINAKAALDVKVPATAAAAAAAENHVAEAAAALAAAHAKASEAGEQYQPLGEVFPNHSSGRRLAFARWLVDRQNPLAARVAVNHIWLRHFGSPLVDNMFDFGLRTAAPRNGPLLDWLACELMDHGWQMKHIHKLMVMSGTYRMLSTGRGAMAANVERDPDNHYLWRMNPRRMESEAVRDSVFFTSGNLDLTRGGPDLPFKTASDTPRRSLYFQHAYEKESRMLELFDSASVNECYRRSESVVPQQALALANSEVSVNGSRRLAKSLAAAAAKEPDGQTAFVRMAFESVLCREPNERERQECSTFLAKQTELLRGTSELTSLEGGAKASVAPAADPEQRARENLTLVLFNHNDFITVR